LAQVRSFQGGFCDGCAVQLWTQKSEDHNHNTKDETMNDELIPLSVLALELDPPSVGGWSALLAGRGITIKTDDIGRQAITRHAARQLFAEREAAEVRRREVVARNDAEAEARRQASIRPGWTLPAGMSVAEAIAAAEYAEHGYSGPRRRTPVEDALDPDGGLVFHPIRDEPAGGGS
jgi:hypothetical protein